jgi:hypothetical protein
VTRAARLTLLAGVLVLGTVVVGCGTMPDDGGDPGSFIPLARDFEDFRSWPSSMITGSAQGSIHLAGARVIYTSKQPEADGVTYPMGTMIVKTVETGELFARAKRGGTFNSRGAVGWEWLELAEVTNGLAIKWRGITPPLGACYGGIVGGACNDCHKAAAERDFVFSQPPPP